MKVKIGIVLELKFLKKKKKTERESVTWEWTDDSNKEKQWAM